MARRIGEHHLGSKPKRTAEIGGGLTNFVFEINHADGDFVVRLSPLPGKIKDYLKEQWAMARAAEMGVPVPEVMEVGPTWSPSPTWCRARSGGRKPPTTPQRFAVLREMGRLTALIHTVQPPASATPSTGRATSSPVRRAGPSTFRASSRSKSA